MAACLNLRRASMAAASAALSLLVAACLLTPGKFVSALDLRKDGHFTFSYKGEIYMLGLSRLAEMGHARDQTFEPSPCYKDDNETVRPCSETERTRQKTDWDEQQKSSTDKAKKDAEQARVLFGGIDPTSPRAAEEMAERLRKQAGWKSVIYKGDGLYEVDFAITGTIDHDFAFPTIERFTMANAFVVLNRRSDGSVRIDAPGFGPTSGSGNAMGTFAQMAAMEGKKDQVVKMPELDGSFSLTTNGTILANNTDEGARNDPAGLRLAWVVTPRSGVAPTALVALDK